MDGCLSSLKLYKLHFVSLLEHGIFGYLNLWNLCSQVVVPLSSYSDRSLFGLLSECLVEASPLFSLKAFRSEPLGLPLALDRCLRLWLPSLFLAFLFTFWNFEGILGFVLAVSGFQCLWSVFICYLPAFVTWHSSSDSQLWFFFCFSVTLTSL